MPPSPIGEGLGVRSEGAGGEVNFFKLYFNSDTQLKQLAIDEALAYPTFLPTLEKLAKAASGIVDAVWNNDKSEIPAELFNSYNDNLHKGIGNSSNLLKNNVSRLAAAKTNYTVQQLHDAKIAAKGSKDEYTKQAKLILGRANSTQAAEYNTAVHRARVVQQWKQFQGERHLYPNIEWLRTRSATPREIHLAYVGRIWPMNDPFWNSNSPGCTWNCKCSWKTTDEKPTDNGSLSVVEASAGLEGNPYYTNEIFTSKHPYFSRVEKHVPNLGPLHNDDEVAFISKKTTQGNKYLEHFNCKDEDEISKNRLAVEELLWMGYKDIKLLPQIHKSEIALRERYYGKEFQKIQKTACPDSMIDGELVEFKSSNKKHISKHILAAAGKSSIAYVELTETLSSGYLDSFIRGQWNKPDRLNLHTIIMKNAGKTKAFKRP